MRKQIKRTKRTEKKNEQDKQNTTAEIQIFPAQVFPANVLFNKHTHTWKRGLGVGNGEMGKCGKVPPS